MKRLITGVDGDGRSCAVDESELSFTEHAPGLVTAAVYGALEPGRPRPHGRGDYLDLGMQPGAIGWGVLRYEPNAAFSTIHHTDSIDFNTIVAGNIDLILDDGSHALSVGDCVVMTGVDHAWQAGPQGCTLSTVALGTPPPT